MILHKLSRSRFLARWLLFLCFITSIVITYTALYCKSCAGSTETYNTIITHEREKNQINDRIGLFNFRSSHAHAHENEYMEKQYPSFHQNRENIRTDEVNGAYLSSVDGQADVDLQMSRPRSVNVDRSHRTDITDRMNAMFGSLNFVDPAGEYRQGGAHSEINSKEGNSYVNNLNVARKHKVRNSVNSTDDQSDTYARDPPSKSKGNNTNTEIENSHFKAQKTDNQNDKDYHITENSRPQTRVIKKKHSNRKSDPSKNKPNNKNIIRKSSQHEQRQSEKVKEENSHRRNRNKNDIQSKYQIDMNKSPTDGEFVNRYHENNPTSRNKPTGIKVHIGKNRSKSTEKNNLDGDGKLVNNLVMKSKPTDTNVRNENRADPNKPTDKDKKGKENIAVETSRSDGTTVYRRDFHPSKPPVMEIKTNQYPEVHNENGGNPSKSTVIDRQNNERHVYTGNPRPTKSPVKIKPTVTRNVKGVSPRRPTTKHKKTEETIEAERFHSDGKIVYREIPRPSKLTITSKAPDTKDQIGNRVSPSALTINEKKNYQSIDMKRPRSRKDAYKSKPADSKVRVDNRVVAIKPSDNIKQDDNDNNKMKNSHSVNFPGKEQQSKKDNRDEEESHRSISLNMKYQRSTEHTPTETNEIVTDVTRKDTDRAYKPRLPSITLYIRMPGKQKKQRSRFYCYFYRTAVLFWPSWLGKTVVVLDEESPTDHTFGDNLIRQNREHFPDRKLEVLYEALPNDPSILTFKDSPHNHGYNRQLWSSFFIDKYTNDAIIAWMDADAAFTTPVTTPTIFNGSRIRILGSDCSMGNPWTQSWARTTHLALGLPMLMDFMTYFPVYLYRYTVIKCREHILRRFNTTDFEEAFKRFYYPHSGELSPVSVIISYAWFFERNRYDWNMGLMCHNLKSYNQKFPRGDKIAPEHVRYILPEPQTAFHVPHSLFVFSRKYILVSYCLAHAAAGNHLPMCHEYSILMQNLLVLFTHDLQRAGRDSSPCIAKRKKNLCLKILYRHFNRVGAEMKRNTRKLDWSVFETVERLANEVNVKCDGRYRLTG